MTKIDERSVVPAIDDSARQRVAGVLERKHVVGALLFGSQATGRAGPLSDVDVAVWLDPALPSKARFDLRLELGAAVAEALRTDEIDLVVLNDAPPLLRHRVLRDGMRILDRDPRARVRLETAALLQYLDTAPLRSTLAAARRARIAEGRFGRR